MTDLTAIPAKLDALDNDPEQAHLEADRLLIDALTELGYMEIVNAWLRAQERIGFWYA